MRALRASFFVRSLLCSLCVAHTVTAVIRLVLVDSRSQVTQLCDAAIKEARNKGQCTAQDIQITRVDGCVPDHPAEGTINAIQLYYQNMVDAYIAPACLDELEEIARLSYFNGLPVLTRSPVSPEILNIDYFPNVVQFSPASYAGLGRALIAIAGKLDSTQVTLVGPKLTADDYPIAEGLNDYLTAAYNTQLTVKSFIEVGDPSDDMGEIRSEIKQSTKLIALSGDFPSLSTAWKQLGIQILLQDQFIIVIVCSVPAETCISEIKSEISVNGVLVLAPVIDNFDTFNNYLVSAQIDTQNITDKRLFNQYMALYNACYGYCFKSNENYKNGATFQKQFINATFTNAMGTSLFDGGGSLVRNYEVVVSPAQSDNLSTVMLFYSVPTSCSGSSSCFDVVVNDTMSSFWDERRAQHIDPCVLSGNCRNYLTYILGAIGVIALLFLAAAGYWFRRKRRLNMFRMHWKIAKENLKIIENKQSSLKGKSVGTGADLSSKRRAIASYALLGTTKAEYLALKQMRKIRWTRPELKFLFELKQVTHDNLTRFMGICCNDLDNFYVLHALVERASLEDFVLDHEFNLDATFKSAFIRDILKGLQFLHKSPIGYHGLLTVQNCLIDANWVLKLTNFGISSMIHEFIRVETLRPVEMLPLQIYQNFAPELLQELEIGKNLPKGTVAGDIYSFGMILYHIVFRSQPYDRYPMSPREILDQIINNNLKPNVSNTDDDPLLNIMNECWDERPDKRPKVRQISQTVSKAFQAAKGNLVDQMIKMNEKYAQNLEKIVAERNAMLQVAQEQTNRLLCEMLPASVAQVLKNGGTIPPRSYESVTVLFCQLVDFPLLCSKSNADQIVTFLNDAFTLFDEIIKLHDAYKVETTGETYMVASGVPNENEGNHVFEIADVSLELREASYQYKVAHYPEFKVRVRIGFHCGPIAAGVIGLKSPRYCLFGDTVNFASRMQSNCPPNQIQTSEITAQKLFDVQEYKLVKRGIVHVKGKGEVNCYWLNEHIHENHNGNHVNHENPEKESDEKKED